MVDSLEELRGKRLGAVLVRIDSDEKSFICGTVEEQAGWYSLVGDGFAFPLPEDLKERVRRFDKATAEHFDGAEYLIFLSVTPVPEDADPTDFVRIGLQWPKKTGPE